MDWWPYEQNGYRIDGMERCGRLLGDRFLIDKAGRSIDCVLGHPAPNGYLGPRLDPDTGKISRCLTRHYFAGDRHYSGDRDAVNIETILWLYGRTGDQRLKAMAERIYAEAFATNPANPVSAAALLKDAPWVKNGFDQKSGHFLFTPPVRSGIGVGTGMEPAPPSEPDVRNYRIRLSG
ncbi:MAG TPA: hypothetical protein VGL42_05925 [Opitutaceae bacterium]